MVSSDDVPAATAAGLRWFVPRDPAFEGRVRESFGRQAFMAHCGAEIASVKPGEVTLIAAHQDALTQQHGLFHGGLVATLADTAAGYAALTLMRPSTGVLTVEFKINLMAPARGQRLVATGIVLRPGRTLTTCRADVAAVDGERSIDVAVALLTMMCVDGYRD
jgi:uncharacterized protein (TIGR00369 family)